MRYLYTLAILLSSALLFLIQPLAAKVLLPTFGGSPQVWTTAMLFFQTLLLGGYATAHKHSATLKPKVHIGVIASALLISAILLSGALTSPALKTIRDSAPNSGNPAIPVLLALLVFVGPIYFVFAGNSPTLQRWFSRTGDPRASNPYFLYAASNLGSFGGLLAYPFLIEPNFALDLQVKMVSIGAVVLSILIALLVLFQQSETTTVASEPKNLEKTPTKLKATWIALAAIPSSLLLGCTVYLSSNVAPVPLIWIAPLGLYLLTFSLAFSEKNLPGSAMLSRAFPLIATPLAFPMILESTEPLGLLATLHLGVLFVGAWLCHRRLADLRPAPEKLTEFYVYMSIGGAVGGLFNGIVAPLIFNGYHEYPLAITLALLARLSYEKPKPDRDPNYTSPDDDRPIRVPHLALSLVPWAILLAGLFFVQIAQVPPSTLRNGLVIGIPLIVSFFLADFHKHFAIAVGGVFLLSGLFQIGSQGKILVSKRSFFGVHRVMQEARYNSLVHGTTTHGRQSLVPGKKLLPLTYYHPTGPIGQVFSSPNFMANVKTIGLVGLGVGSLAAYGTEEQEMTFFEIDPEVLEIAKNPEYFTFLQAARAKMRYVLGDARLTLAKEPDGKFDLLVLDAFSSDAIPTHLLTVEALQLYKRKLSPNGIVVFHISNRYLELGGILAATAKMVGWKVYDNIDAPVGDEALDGKTQSHWALLAPSIDPVNLMVRPPYWSFNEEADKNKPWTDDYSNVLGAFKPPE